MPACRGCTEEFEPAQLVEDLCSKCRTNLGLPPTPIPVLRPKGPCRGCGHPEILQSIVRERAARGADYVYDYAAPLAVSLGARDVTTLFSNRKKGTTAALDDPYGLIVAYVCRSCGFTELYTINPGHIPVGPEFGTRLLDATEGREGPYR